MSFKPMNNDVLVSFLDTNDMYDGVIHVQESRSTKLEQSLQYCKVEAVSDNASKVMQVGDTITIKISDHTEPFEWEGKRVALTELKRILCVIEE